MSRMLATLIATNEAIMRARAPTELYRMVCEAAAADGRFLAALIALPDPLTGEIRAVAWAGPLGLSYRDVRASIRPDVPEGQGVSGQAFRNRVPAISNDYLGDRAAAAFHGLSRRQGGLSAAAFPLFSQGETIGLLVLMAGERDVFTEELTALLVRLADNISFALENFARIEERALADLQRDRLTRMLAALSATNEAIMRARSRIDLFQQVCEAAVQGGRFQSTLIAIAEPGQIFMRVMATAGPQGEEQRTVRLSVDERYPEGRGVSGTAFRTGRPCIINDYLADRRGLAFHERARAEGNRAGAALPLFCGGQVVGVLVFMAGEAGTFTPDLVELLQRLASNVSFALDNFRRIDAQARADEQIKYLATHDGLTDLPNRSLFNRLLHTAIESSRRHAWVFALLFVDLDSFKMINDTYGHDSGDLLLVEISGRLRRHLRDGDVVARLGGDEFVVILQPAGQREQVEIVARKLLAVIEQPVILPGGECRVSASIGIALFPGDGEDEHSLLRNADKAMYLAKEDGKSQYRFFLAGADGPARERTLLENDLPRAFEQGEFSLVYQPKIDVVSGQVAGVEAFLRWLSPRFGLVPPSHFLPIAEELGLSRAIGRWVLTQAASQGGQWRASGLAALPLAINLSPRQFFDDHFLDDLDEILRDDQLPPETLELEITESMVMRNVVKATERLAAIRARGVRLSVDDFGTGYSSIALIKRFPLDSLKIDQSFVQDLPHDPDDRAIAQAIIGMAKALGLTVVAEGVETPGQAALLRRLGCDQLQGHLIARPVQGDRLPALIAAVAASRLRLEEEGGLV